MPNPSNNYLIYGYVYGPDGAIIISSADVTAAIGSNVLTTTTNSLGRYLVDLQNHPAGFSNGSSVSLKAVKSGIGTKTETITVNTGQGGEQKDITLVESTGEFPYEEATSHQVTRAVPTHPDGGYVKVESPLPILDTFSPEKQNIKTEFNYNSTDELIWIYQTVNGIIYEMQVTDDSYSGGAAKGDITRTKTFNSWSLQ